ncbi:SDR family oxidoreductase [Nocardiopsis sp. YSL2]|uniref:SDR family oxidoreductase n=1 Tax=Nocardiopsis sp. YSL2 TaxID=2939492 RepID=UPI0026F45279|nr:NAD(P)H-binding protein [Nocardiopsis sp. YSL2]
MIVVTGATGNVGRPLVRGLAAAGAPVRAVARNLPGDEAIEGVDYRQADLTDAGSLRPALERADALFLLLAGDLLGGAVDPNDLVGQVKAAGVSRVVVLSSQAVGTRPEAAAYGGLRALEAAVQGSGLEWTILRPGGFYTNAYAFVEPVREQGVVVAPFGDVGLPMLDPADVAAVAAAVLCEDGHAGRTYELTGPALLTPRKQAEEIGRALGTDVGFVELTRDQARENMLRFMPEPVADATLTILGEPVAAEQKVRTDVERVTGRAPRAFGEWAADNSMVFR